MVGRNLGAINISVIDHILHLVTTEKYVLVSVIRVAMDPENMFGRSIVGVTKIFMIVESFLAFAIHFARVLIFSATICHLPGSNPSP